MVLQHEEIESNSLKCVQYLKYMECILFLLCLVSKQNALRSCA